MENKLKALFDYQRFAGNLRLAALIDKTEQKYVHELSDDELELVSAAGESNAAGKQNPPKPEDSGNA